MWFRHGHSVYVGQFAQAESGSVLFDAPTRTITKRLLHNMLLGVVVLHKRQ